MKILTIAVDDKQMPPALSITGSLTLAEAFVYLQNAMVSEAANRGRDMVLDLMEPEMREQLTAKIEAEAAKIEAEAAKELAPKPVRTPVTGGNNDSKG